MHDLASFSGCVLTQLFFFLTSERRYLQCSIPLTKGISRGTEMSDSLLSISQQVGCSLNQLRGWNPQLSSFADGEPLPPETKVSFKRKQASSSPSSARLARAQTMPVVSSPPPKDTSSTNVSSPPPVPPPTPKLSSDTMRIVAQKTGVPLESLRSWNPSLNHIGDDDPLPDGTPLTVRKKSLRRSTSQGKAAVSERNSSEPQATGINAKEPTLKERDSGAASAAPLPPVERSSPLSPTRTSIANTRSTLPFNGVNPSNESWKEMRAYVQRLEEDQKLYVEKNSEMIERFATVKSFDAPRHPASEAVRSVTAVPALPTSSSHPAPDRVIMPDGQVLTPRGGADSRAHQHHHHHASATVQPEKQYLFSDTTDDEEPESLVVIARRTRKTVPLLRELNPHLALYGDNDPLPVGTKLRLAKKASDTPASSGGPISHQGSQSQRSLVAPEKPVAAMIKTPPPSAVVPTEVPTVSKDTTTFVVDEPSLSLNVISSQLGINPVELYDLNIEALARAKIRFNDPLPLGFLLQFPSLKL